MTEPLQEATHVTLGRNFRTPAHPRVLAALGRALYCFLSLEESVTAIMFDAGAATLPMTRGKMAGAKEQALADLAERYRASVSGAAVADSLDAAVTAFRTARKSVRNELLHAHPYTAGEDASGNYLPGLAYTARDGRSWRTVSSTPEDLLDLATEVERATYPLSAAREAVRALPLSAL
jgi:hypothetical protein